MRVPHSYSHSNIHRPRNKIWFLHVLVFKYIHIICVNQEVISDVKYEVVRGTRIVSLWILH